jgi:hypothetical protein
MHINPDMIVQALMVAVLSGVGGVVWKTAIDLARITAILEGLKQMIADLRETHDREMSDIKRRVDAITCAGERTRREDFRSVGSGV